MSFRSPYISEKRKQQLFFEYPLQLGSQNPLLRSIALPVQQFDQQTKKKCEDLLDCMRLYEWVWLAAPQIWLSQQIFAMTFRSKGEKKSHCLGHEVFINPRIIDHSDTMVIHNEACLSLPQQEWEVERYESIVVAYQNVQWHKKIKTLTWFDAVIAQHEIDHLNGILFIDKIVSSHNFFSLM